MIAFTPSGAVRDGAAGVGVELRDWFDPGDRASSAALLGWAASRTGMPVEVEFYLNGTLVASAPVRHERPDVVAALGPGLARLRCGFHARLSKFVLGADAALDLILFEERDGRPARVELGTVTGIPGPAATGSYRERYSPLLVLGLGRSGTTRLMELLSGHPELVVPGGHPYELRTPCYLWQAAHVLSAPADQDHGMSPDGFESRMATSVGFSPYRNHEWEHVTRPGRVRWQEEELPPACIDFCKQQVDAFVESCLPESGPRPRYVAQKTLLSPMRYLVANTHPGMREIFLVRDFRDVWLSARQFNCRRGTASFGRDGFASDLDWMRGLGHSSRELRLAHQAADARALLVRYEDLIGNPVATLGRVLRHLEVDAASAVIDALLAGARHADQGQARAHMTAASAEAACGRWAREMTADEKRVAAKVFGRDLAYFGYETEETAGQAAMIPAGQPTPVPARPQ